MPFDINHNEHSDDDYFFKKYYTWRGEARIARAPTDARVVRDDVLTRMTLGRFESAVERHATAIYCLTLVQAWEDGCRSDCVETCTCEHREFPYELEGVNK